MNTKILNLFEFCFDRQQVWYNKEILKLNQNEWTNNIILKKYLFCNVYRELDTGTKYIIESVLNKNISPQKKLFNVLIYRIFNRRNFFEEISNGLFDPDNFNFKYYEGLFDSKKCLGLWRPAYQIAQTPFDKTYRPSNGHIQKLLIAKSIIPKLGEILEQIKNDPITALDILQKYIYGVGPFLSLQLLLDLTYSRNNGIQDIVNYSNNDFCLIGPGAKQPLIDIFGNNSIESLKSLVNLQEEYFKILKDQIGKDWFIIKYNSLYFKSDYLSISNIEHLCCEFRKYTNLIKYEKDPINNKCRLRYYK
jgi:hypothetical protein